MNPSDAVCYAAIVNNCFAYKHIAVCPKDVLHKAIAKNGKLLQFVSAEDQTEELCIAAVSAEPTALMYVKNQTEAIVIAAVTRSYSAFGYVDKSVQTEDICLIAVASEGTNIRNVAVQTQLIANVAYAQNVASAQRIESRFLKELKRVNLNEIRKQLEDKYGFEFAC